MRTWFAAPLFGLLALGCGSDEAVSEGPVGPPELVSDDARVLIHLDPFYVEIFRPDGGLVLRTLEGGGKDAYGAPSATIDDPLALARPLPGWDGYLAQEGAWRHGVTAEVVSRGNERIELTLSGENFHADFAVGLSNARVRFEFAAREQADEAAENPLNKSTIAFESSPDEHFFGMGERFATTDHRGWSLYSWPEEGALGRGENAPVDEQNPFPNGPSMTYFPVPFFLSTHGYGMHLDTTFRSEAHFASERDDAYRVAVNRQAFSTTIYVHEDPLLSLRDYTEDSGKPIIPADWVFGPRRRVGSGSMVNGVPEIQAMRDADIAITGVDDAVHFLPASSQTGREAELAAWTKAGHAAGYKVMAYNNPYVAESDENAAADYAYGVEHGLFVKTPDKDPFLTEFISGKNLQLATIDLTNPEAVTWFQSLLQRTLDLGYDGWMHDFGEYIPRDAVLFDGRRGDEVHNEFPVLSAKAAYELMEKQRPGDYLYFVRSGGSGTQAFTPAVWGGDAEATFDETQGLPSAVRGGLNLSMSGVPYWGSDMTGFKCLTNFPHDKEVYLRWVQFGAVSPIMMEQNACSNPTASTKPTKWNLWNDQETIDVYSKMARLHTRLMPYFSALARVANEQGTPITMHPWLLNPTATEAYAIEDAFYVGRSLYALPIVRRGETQRVTWLPPGRFVDVDDFTVYTGGAQVTIPAPLDKLPLLQVENSILPLLDPTIDTLAPAEDPTVVTPADVADRLDVLVALSPGGSATFTLADGTVLEATRLGSDAGAGGLSEVTEADIGDCASCFVASSEGDVQRLRANSGMTAESDLSVADVQLKVSGGSVARRIRWDIRRLK
ncbi:MAG: glycoside hydrolase family 31 protein [Polyangiaceae bacterium]